MEELKKILENPFGGINQDNAEKINERCREIAQKLFGNYCIKCGNKFFRFIEVEFYYYKNEKDCKGNFDSPIFKETYPRSKNSGELFFHYSGVDICFQCNFNEKEKNNDYGEYGGILIRSLLDGNKILAGPLFCANAMLNACKEHMPELMRTDCRKIDLGSSITRYGINSDKNQTGDSKLLLCCFATKVDEKELDWEKTSERILWDKQNHKFKKSTRNYKKRFNYANKN